MSIFLSYFDFPLSEAETFAKMFSKEELHNAICANYKYGIQV